jgi:hypothetical protein
MYYLRIVVYILIKRQLCIIYEYGRVYVRYEYKS